METQSAFMAAAAAAVLLVAVLVRRRDATALRYAALTLCFGLWALGRGGTRLALPGSAALEGVALGLGGPVALGFAAELAGRGASLRPLRLPIVAGAALLAASSVATSFEPAVLRATAVTWAALHALAAGALLWWLRPSAAAALTPEETRLRYLTASHGFVTAGLGLDALLWWLGGPPIATLLAGLLYLYAGYLYLARVRVVDVRQLLGNSVALVLLAAGLAGVFLSLRVWVGERLDLFVFDAFIASFVLLLGYRPISERIQAAVERRFAAGKLELERTLQPLGERMPQIFTLDELLRELLATLERSDRVTASAVFLREDPHVGFRLVASIGLPSRPRVNLIREEPFVGQLESGEPILIEELEKGLSERRPRAEHERLQGLVSTLRELDAQLVVPLIAGSHLVGFWTLTDSSSREPFSMTEVKLLRGVADQAAISVENSRTFEAVRARDRLAALGEMAGGLAHEIRNPLATIRGAVELLDESREVSPELRTVIQEEVQRMDRVITLFLDYARPSLRRIAIDDPGEFVRSCVRGVTRHQAAAGVCVAIEVEPDIPPLVADADQLETVISNVVQNAYEAVRGKGRIRIAVRARRTDADPGVEIALEDDGPGMDEETLARAFVPFFTTKDGGTGLGLALCERLVRAQGGSIELRAQPGEGTSVVISLPSRAGAPREAA